MTIDKSPFKEQILAAAGDCAKYLLVGEWVFPTELCRIDPITCPYKAEECLVGEEETPPVQCKEYFHLWCNDSTYSNPFYDPVTDKLRCKKDCFEAGALGYAPGEAGVPGD